MGAWALNPDPLPETIENLPKIHYIYCTHEHPDHFHPPSLKKLLEGPAKGATLCIPRYMVDRFAPRVRQFAGDTPILEMAHGKKYMLGSLEAWSYQYRNDDTTLVLRAQDGYIKKAAYEILAVITQGPVFRSLRSLVRPACHAAGS